MLNLEMIKQINIEETERLKLIIDRREEENENLKNYVVYLEELLDEHNINYDLTYIEGL